MLQWNERSHCVQHRGGGRLGLRGGRGPSIGRRGTDKEVEGVGKGMN